MSKFQVTEIQEVVSTEYWVYEVEAETQEEAVENARNKRVHSVIVSGKVGDPDYNDFQGFGVDVAAALEDAGS